MAYVSFFEHLHKKTDRDYTECVTKYDKPACVEVSRQYGKDYWDGDRKYGYGGYSYDGRWKQVAEKMIAQYNLADGARILDIGCGKGFLLFEFSQLLPNATISGLDISEYAVENAKPEVKEFIAVGNAKELPYADNSFDFVLSNSTLHNLQIYNLIQALSEIERVSAKDAWVCIESYRNAREQVNLQNWSLTAHAFFDTSEWEWIFKQAGYTGDHEFFFFE